MCSRPRTKAMRRSLPGKSLRGRSRPSGTDGTNACQIWQDPLINPFFHLSRFLYHLSNIIAAGCHFANPCFSRVKQSRRYCEYFSKMVLVAVWFSASGFLFSETAFFYYTIYRFCIKLLFIFNTIVCRLFCIFPTMNQICNKSFFYPNYFPPPLPPEKQKTRQSLRFNGLL